MKTSLALSILLLLGACSGKPKTTTVTEGTGGTTYGSGGSGGSTYGNTGGENESMRGQACPDDASCPSDMQCVTYYGIAGTNGPSFNSCETPCDKGKGCPEGLSCTTIADGPGQVCR
jgi:hypothetical protein